MNGSDGVESTADDLKMIGKAEVARLLAISVRTLDRLIKTGRIVPPERIGRIARWPRLKLRQWMEAGCPMMSDGERTVR